jgi:hypothetical protein
MQPERCPCDSYASPPGAIFIQGRVLINCRRSSRPWYCARLAKYTLHSTTASHRGANDTKNNHLCCLLLFHRQSRPAHHEHVHTNTHIFFCFFIPFVWLRGREDRRHHECSSRNCLLDPDPYEARPGLKLRCSHSAVWMYCYLFIYFLEQALPAQLCPSPSPAQA